MDNQSFFVVSNGKNNLIRILEIVFSKYSRAVGYIIDNVEKSPRLILFWSCPDNKNFQKFLVPLDVIQTCDLLWEWLQNLEYDLSGDEDVEYGKAWKAWKVYCNGWGQIDNYGWESFCCVEPSVAMYGK